MTLEEYKYITTNRLEQLGLVKLFKAANNLTNQTHAEDLYQITVNLIVKSYEDNINPIDAAEVIYTAAVYAFSDIFGEVEDNLIKH